MASTLNLARRRANWPFGRDGGAVLAASSIGRRPAALFGGKCESGEAGRLVGLLSAESAEILAQGGFCVRLPSTAVSARAPCPDTQ